MSEHENKIIAALTKAKQEKVRSFKILVESIEVCFAIKINDNIRNQPELKRRINHGKSNHHSTISAV